MIIASEADAPQQFDTSADVRRLSRLSQEIMDLIHTDEDGDWTVNVLHEHVHDDHLHLLAAPAARTPLQLRRNCSRHPPGSGAAIRHDIQLLPMG